MNPDIRIKIRQFLWKAMHGTNRKILDAHKWIRGTAVETMEHILIHCQESAVRIIWDQAQEIWPHAEIPWPEISLGIILGCGATTIADAPNDNIQANHQRPPVPKKAAA
jgi:hypothetical protein